jgi:hypothetical protein
MKNSIKGVILGFGLFIGTVQSEAQLPADYKGIPYKDSVYTGNKLNPIGAQNLPGRIELAWYDRGGEGVAYHDNTPKNEGAVFNKKAGEQRPGISDYLAFFREKDGVDINYTKDNLDFTPANKVHPKSSQLYISNQEEGEWTNYSIYVHQKGKYIIYTTYCSVDPKPVELWVNHQFAGRLIFPEKTGDLHFWTQSEVGQISFPAPGVYLLTVKYNGGMNFGYLDFLYNNARQN